MGVGWRSLSLFIKWDNTGESTFKPKSTIQNVSYYHPLNKIPKLEKNHKSPDKTLIYSDRRIKTGCPRGGCKRPSCSSDSLQGLKTWVHRAFLCRQTFTGPPRMQTVAKWRRKGEVSSQTERARGRCLQDKVVRSSLCPGYCLDTPARRNFYFKLYFHCRVNWEDRNSGLPEMTHRPWWDIWN